jgi:hypothetical protein
MDFSKAFDKVSHSLIIHKLKHYGITGKTNEWIKNFLSDRTQSVVVEGETSTSISVLEPSLFLFYINDMPEGIQSTVRLFADDTIAYVTISSDANAANLQQDLDKLAEWESKWLMKFHPRYATNRYHNTSSVSSMIEQLEWTTLQERRKHSRLLMMYKLKNNIVRVDASSKLIPNERPSRNNNEQALPIPSCKTTVRKDSFYPRTTKEWNTLPNCTVSQSVPRVLNPSRLGSVIKLK